MQALLRFSNWIDSFTEIVGKVAYWLVPLMVLVGVWNVFGRFFGQSIGVNLTSNALIEMQWYIFSLVFFLGAPYALLHNDHVRVDVLYARMGSRQRAWVNTLGALLILIPFCSLLIYFSWNFIGTSWSGLEQSPDPSGLPRYPIKTMVALGPALLIVQAVSETIKNVGLLMGARTAQPHEESEGEQEAREEQEARDEQAAQAAQAQGAPPSSDDPPAGNPPAGNPPAGNPPAGNPPAGNPPAGNPPAGNPPQEKKS